MGEDKRPAPFRMVGRDEWIECDRDGLEGFAIKVKSSITNRERYDLIAKHDAEVVALSRQWMDMSPEERAEHEANHDTPREREWAIIAPYVLDWNAVGVDDDGNDKPIPAPAAGGPDVFYAIEPDAMDWIGDVVLLGYRATGKAAKLSKKSSDSQDKPSGPRIVENN